MNYLEIYLFCAYSLFIVVESTAMVARHTGVVTGYSAMGYALHNAILALNRFIGFTLAPVVAYLLDTGYPRYRLFVIAFILSFVGGLLTFCCAKRSAWFGNYFNKILTNISANGYKINSFFMAKNFNVISKRMENLKLVGRCDLRLLSSVAFTTALYYGVSFYLALLSFSFDGYRATILQLTGAVTGFGSLLLNFYSFPKLTYWESMGEVSLGIRSVFWGKVAGLVVLQPAFLLLCNYLK